MKTLYLGNPTDVKEASEICHEEAKKHGFNEWHEWWYSELGPLGLELDKHTEAFKFLLSTGGKYDKSF